MNNIDYSDYFAEAAKALFDSLTPEQQARAKVIGRMQASYVSTPRDKRLDIAFDGLLENAAAALFGKAGKRRALFVVGEAGSGKTTAVEHHVKTRKQFSARTTADGREVEPLVYFEAPKPLTLKGLASAGLQALNYEVEARKLNEQEIFDLWKVQLRENRALYLWIDEMQHVLRGNTTKEIQNVADVIKSLVQIPGWPLHLILSGVPTLAKFLHQEGDADGQLSERSFVVELRALSVPENLPAVIKIVKQIVTKDAKLTMDGIDTDDFAHRLLHACNGAFGSTIQMIRTVCEHALRNNESSLSSATFGASYALISGCRPDQNVFTSPNRLDIVPKNALSELLARAARLDKQAAEQARPSRKKRG
jgi:hypothetical protein